MSTAQATTISERSPSAGVEAWMTSREDDIWGPRECGTEASVEKTKVGRVDDKTRN
jgi:hypothetical protein